MTAEPQNMRIDATGAQHSGWLIPLSSLIRDRRGAGAVEFALIVPILLALYIGAFEVTLGLSVAKRAARAAGTVADAVTQQTSVTKAYLDTMKDAAEANFVPYSTKGMKLSVTGITIDADTKATVLWSWADDKTRPYAVGSPVTVPQNLLKPSSFIVHAEVSINHQLLLFVANSLSMESSTLPIHRDYYNRPRLGNTVTCTDC